MSTDDLYSRIVKDRGKVENLIARLPGFGGYMEMTARRQADRMMRDHVAGKLRGHLSRLAVIENSLLDAGGLSYMTKTRSVKTKFQTLIDRIATSSPGYSGFFDAIKVDATDLQVVYAFDEAMLEYGDKFGEKLDTLASAVSAGEGIEAAIAELDALTIEANQAYSLRDNVLKDLQ